jgi:ABC-type transport system involved in cytochrome c biogenesis permease subunit
MQRLLFLILILLGGVAPAMAGESRLDFAHWRTLPVQDEGRRKPFDTLARETIYSMTGRSGIADPDSGRFLPATELYMALLFDNPIWDQPLDDRALSRTRDPDAYADRWDQTPLFPIGSTALKDFLNLPKSQKYLSPSELRKLTVSMPDSDKSIPLFDYANTLSHEESQSLSPVEKSIVELVNRYKQFAMVRMGLKIAILPIPESKHQDWASLLQLMIEDDQLLADDPSLAKTCELFRKTGVKDAFLNARKAFRDHDEKAFTESTDAFMSHLRDIGEKLAQENYEYRIKLKKADGQDVERVDRGDYPSMRRMKVEAGYNHWKPFRIAWILSLAACFAALTAKRFPKNSAVIVSRCLYWLSIIALFVGFTVRSIIAGRAPITNMYESLLSVGLAVAVMGVLCEWFTRKRFYLIEASCVSSLVLILADVFCDPAIRPLMPVLRTGFLLWTHVTTIMVSYAAFTRVWILSNISLGYVFAPNAGRNFKHDLDRLALLLLRIGVFLLTVGTLLGAVWGDYAWGRFWGWDPKEVWALISLLFYVNILHARYVGWLADFGVAFWAALTFLVIGMTYYGVNFMLPSGLHSYGTGSGANNFYVFIPVLIQLAYLATTAFANSQSKCIEKR